MLSIALAGTMLSVGATDINFTYNVNGLDAKVYGFDKKEVYDVAIKIDDPVYVGAKISGFTVDLPVGAGAVENVSGWLSSELKLADKVNVPDIESKSAEVIDEMLNVTFDTPCTIPAGGVWVGYSFKITKLGEEYHWPGSPIACIESTDNLDKGLWVHTSRSRIKWTNLGSTLEAVSTMVVHLQTDFGPYDAAIGVPAQSYMKGGEAYNVPLTVINHGTSPIEDLTYTYSIGDLSASGSVHLDEPVGALGKSAVVEFPLGPVAATGEYPFSLKLETTNGQENNDPMREGSGIMNVWPVIPVTRPLVEEYTGLLCGYCPRGYVAMEWMKENLGDLFVGMAFHSSTYESGCMETVPEKDFPFDVGGYPYADMNREEGMDPSYLPMVWDSYAAKMSPAVIDVDMEWADADHTEALLTSKVAFAKDVNDADYSIAFALVADGLKNEKWRQRNYFEDASEGVGVESPLWDLFVGGPKYVTGLTFNDVVVYFKDTKGIENRLPATIKAGETMTFEYRVPMLDIKNLKGKYFINEGATVHAVAILLDGKTGYSVNCNRSADYEYSNIHLGVEGVSADGLSVVSTEYRNLQGIEVANPANGVYIRTDVMSDGSRRTTKVAVR